MVKERVQRDSTPRQSWVARGHVVGMMSAIMRAQLYLGDMLAAEEMLKSVWSDFAFSINYRCLYPFLDQ